MKKNTYSDCHHVSSCAKNAELNFTFRYIPPSDDPESAKEIANLTYNTEGERGQVPLHIKIDSVMKGKIKKITSPSHTLQSEIKELADENGQYLARTGLGDTTTDVMDRDLVIFIQSENSVYESYLYRIYNMLHQNMMCRIVTHL